MKTKIKRHQKGVTMTKGKLKLLGSGGLSSMSFRDCQRRAIALGMPFPDVPQCDYHKLYSFIMKSPNQPDNSLIDQYDDWVDQQLDQLGYKEGDPMRSYQLRLGFVREDPVTKEKKTKRVKGLEKPKKPKKERDSMGFWAGTKKSYTIELTNKGYSFERILRRVTKKFPDAKEKSIMQWYRKALRIKGITPPTRRTSKVREVQDTEA